MKRASTLQELLKMFGEHLTLSCGRTAATVATYQSSWRQLFKYALHERGIRPTALSVEDLTADFIKDFLHFIMASGKSAATRNNRLAAIQSFFKFLAGHNPVLYGLQAQHVETIVSTGGGTPAMEYLSREEAKAVMDAPNPESRWGVRNRTILTMMVQTALRGSELRALDVEDIYFHPKPGIHVRFGKGRKQRHLPLHEMTVKAVKAWLALRGNAKGPLFTTTRGERMKAGALQLLVASAVRAASKSCPELRGRRITPHTLRHTAAMLMLIAGVDITVIAMYLGHANVQTTYRYLHHNKWIKEQAMAQTQYPEPQPVAEKRKDGLTDADRALLDGDLLVE